MNRLIFIGQWTFRIATTLAPVLVALQSQLVQRSFDPYALGSALVASILVALAHADRAAGERPAILPPRTGGTP